MKIDILLNGEWGELSYPVQGLNTNSGALADRLYIADGGHRHADKIAPCSQVEWWGDFDSTDISPRPEIWEVHKLESDKNLSDFGAILDRLEETLPQQVIPFIEIWGTLGGRTDHERINLCELHRFLGRISGGLVVCHPEILLFRNASFQIDLPKDVRFSIWAENSGAGNISCAGARYSGQVFLERPSHGLSNISLGGNVEIQSLDSKVYALNLDNTIHN